MDVSASVSGEAKGGSFFAGGCSSLGLFSLGEGLFSLGEGLFSLGEELFSAEKAMLGLTSSGVCSLRMSGAVVF